MSKYTKLLSVAGLACLPGMAFADTPTIGSMLEASGIAVSGYVSASYSANLNDGQVLNYRAYDSSTDTVTIDQTSLTIAYAPTSGFGATANVIIGEDSKVINANFGDGNSIISLPTAFVSYANGGLTVIAGRYGSLAGYEVTADNAAPFVSRSFLFNNTQPFFHTGIRASYKVSDLILVQGGIVNSAPLALTVDDNEQKTIEANVTLTPSDALLLSVTDYYGFDQFGAGGTTVGTNMFDVVAQWKATGQLTLAVNGDMYKVDTVAKTQGVALYGLFQATDLIGLRARVELAEFNPKGGSKDTFKVFTGAVVLSPAKNFDLIAEARYDTSNHDVFLNGFTNDGENGSVQAFKDTGGNVAVKGIFKF
ncbi:outer membrane beta-barrel protein [Nevskia ramosa]|uniref:outer membrane beta-barrel protein n=1 Tax=Nevskia ramosa TaxID=64002 RepID=UPI0003B4D9C4|nr:outer membrane beta-barrel protein [Nevskia ramosa]